jgi:hypothetical protein
MASSPRTDDAKGEPDGRQARQAKKQGNRAIHKLRTLWTLRIGMVFVRKTAALFAFFDIIHPNR